MARVKPQDVRLDNLAGQSRRRRRLPTQINCTIKPSFLHSASNPFTTAAALIDAKLHPSYV